MAPGNVVSAPSSAAATSNWIVDSVLSLTAWSGSLWLQQGAVKGAKAGTKSLFTKISPRRKALWDCTEATYSAAKQGLNDEARWNAERKPKVALGISASGGKCASGWQDAKQP